MKLFGYPEGSYDQLVTLSEVTVQAGPETLKAIAGFLLKCAREMEEDDSWEHEHFLDSEFTEESSPEVILFRGRKAE